MSLNEFNANNLKKKQNNKDDSDVNDIKEGNNKNFVKPNKVFAGARI